MDLEVHEFVRRFSKHVLPKGFMKVGQYGFHYTNSNVDNIDND